MNSFGSGFRLCIVFRLLGWGLGFSWSGFGLRVRGLSRKEESRVQGFGTYGDLRGFGLEKNFPRLCRIDW